MNPEFKNKISTYIIFLKKTQNKEVCPKNLRAMLEYWYIEHGLWQIPENSLKLHVSKINSSLENIYAQQLPFSYEWMKTYLSSHQSTQMLVYGLAIKCPV